MPAHVSGPQPQIGRISSRSRFNKSGRKVNLFARKVIGQTHWLVVDGWGPVGGIGSGSILLHSLDLSIGNYL